MIKTQIFVKKDYEIVSFILQTKLKTVSYAILGQSISKETGR